MKGHANSKKKKNDRRGSARYPINLPVRYSLPHGTGWGRILNISSSGALLTVDGTQPVGHVSHAAIRGAQPLDRSAEHPFRALAGEPASGGLAELFIGWPVLLNESVHLNLVAKGRVVRAGRDSVAVKFERCDLRTSNTAFLKKVIPADQRRLQDLASV